MKLNSFKASRTPNSARPKGARNQVFRADQERKRREAAIRQAESDAMTPKQRLDRLDARLGKGVGAASERAKLLKQMAVGVNPCAGVAGGVQTRSPGKKTRSPKAAR